jgi:hypothetical protein
MSFADLDILKEDGNITTSNYQHFLQSWSELYRASYNPTFSNLENLKNSLQSNSAITTASSLVIQTKRIKNLAFQRDNPNSKLPFSSSFLC